MTNEILEKLLSGETDVSNIKVPNLRTGFELRPYQKVAAAAFLTHKELLLCDQTGFGKTLQSFTPYLMLKSKAPKLKFIYATVKSGILQAEEEFNRFFEGINTVSISGSNAVKKKREKIYTGGEYDAFFLAHRTMVLDAFYIIHYLQPFILVLDEANYFKGLTSQAHTVSKQLKEAAAATWLLTADPIEKSLEDAYGLMDIIRPDIYGPENIFQRDFCVMGDRYVPAPKWMRGAKVMKVPFVQGYKNKGIFKQRFQLASIGRKRKDIDVQLPNLVIKNLRISLPKNQFKIYKEVEKGLFSGLSGFTKSRDAGDKTGSSLENMIRCQQLLGCPKVFIEMLQNKKEDLLNNKDIYEDMREDYLMKNIEEDDSDDWSSENHYIKEWNDTFDNVLDKLENYKTDTTAKLQEIQRILEDELHGQKVIIFSSYRTVIDFLEENLKQYKPLRITGAENTKKRNNNRKLFTETLDRNLMLVTTAALRALNLQAANAIICHDIPVTWGKLKQLVGRIIRIGSTNKMVNLINLIAKDTIDEKVFDRLDKTQDDVELILGDLGQDKIICSDKGASERMLFDFLTSDD